MSIKTFVKKFEQDMEHLFGKASLEQKIQAGVGYAAPFVEGLLDILDPAAEPFVAKAVAIVEADLGTLITVTSSAAVVPGTPAAATVASALTSINTNLTGLLNVAEVKNSTKVAQITGVVNLVTGEMNELLAGLATLPPAPAPAVAA